MWNISGSSFKIGPHPLSFLYKLRTRLQIVLAYNSITHPSIRLTPFQTILILFILAFLFHFVWPSSKEYSFNSSNPQTRPTSCPSILWLTRGNEETIEQVHLYPFLGWHNRAHCSALELVRTCTQSPHLLSFMSLRRPLVPDRAHYSFKTVNGQLVLWCSEGALWERA